MDLLVLLLMHVLYAYQRTKLPTENNCWTNAPTGRVDRNWTKSGGKAPLPGFLLEGELAQVPRYPGTRTSPGGYLHRVWSFGIRPGRHAHGPGSSSASCCCNGSVGSGAATTVIQLPIALSSLKNERKKERHKKRRKQRTSGRFFAPTTNFLVGNYGLRRAERWDDMLSMSSEVGEIYVCLCCICSHVNLYHNQYAIYISRHCLLLIASRHTSPCLPGRVYIFVK